MAKSARAGDASAVGELYGRHRLPLFRHAYRMLGNEAAAHDVVQEAFTRALAAIGRTREELRFKPWIFRIATNLCLRQLTVRKRFASDEGRPEAAAEPGAGDPEQHQRRHEIAALVAEALEATPARYRQLLLLRELEELSYEELAQVLERPVSQVKVTLHRARSRFSAEFVAARLLASPEAPSVEVECPDLAALIAEPETERREVVKHLESCKRCRQRRRRPAGELFALLPGVPTLPEGAPPVLEAASSSTTAATASAAQTSAAAPAAAAAGWGVFAKVSLVSLGAVAIVSAFVFTATDEREARAPEEPPRRLTSPAPAPAHVTPTRPARRAARPAATATPVPMPIRPTRAARTKRAPPPAMLGKRNWRPRRLALRLSLAATKVTVERKGKAPFTLRFAREVRIGDVLRAAPGRSFGLQLPGDQWIGVGGALRIDAMPRMGEGRIKIRVTLLAGWLRGKATVRGGGLSITVGARRIAVDRGALRLRRGKGQRVRLETLKGTYATVTSPPTKSAPEGLARSVPPHSGLTFSSKSDAGYSRALLPGPKELRPLMARRSTPPTLSWATVAGASGYIVELSRDTDFIEVVRAYRTRRRTLRPAGLRPGAYYWQVSASDGAHRGRPSKIFRFVVLAR